MIREIPYPVGSRNRKTEPPDIHRTCPMPFHGPGGRIRAHLTQREFFMSTIRFRALLATPMVLAVFFLLPACDQNLKMIGGVGQRFERLERFPEKLPAVVYRHDDGKVNVTGHAFHSSLRTFWFSWLVSHLSKINQRISPIRLDITWLWMYFTLINKVL